MKKNTYHIGICKKCGIKRLLGDEDNLCADCIDIEDVDLNEVIARVKASKVKVK